MPFIRVKWRKSKSGAMRGYKYRVKNYREGGKVKQQVIEYLGPAGIRDEVGTTDSQVGTTKYKDKQKVYSKRLDEMSFAEKRVLAKRLNVPSGGINNRTLTMRLKKALKKKKVSETEAFQFTEQGTITTVTFPEKDFQVQVIDQDIEFMEDVKTKRMGPGMYNIQQETIKGEDESVTIMVSHTKPPETQKKKRKRRKKKK